MKSKDVLSVEPKRRKPHANTDDIQIGQGWDVSQPKQEHPRDMNRCHKERGVIPKYVKERDVAFGSSWCLP